METHNKFYIVATPIGNLGDISQRAVETLKEVDVVLCEDTRVTRKLLNAYDIATKTQSYHAQVSEKKENDIVEHIKRGVVFALVSDAGTPTISDPGVRLIAKIRKELPEVQILSIPGPTAFVSALSVSGFDGNQFTFYGFLPHKKGRGKIFDEIAQSSRISVFYESPHRLMKTLEELAHRFEHARKLCVARELTKIYEESLVFTAREMFDYYLSQPEKVRGEFVVIIDK